MPHTSKILLVDDDRLILKVIAGALSRKGFECYKADSVAEALKILKQAVPDMILSDYSMPKMDGFEFRKLVLMDKRWKNIPFVFFTSFGGQELMQQGLNMQAIDYIDKNTPMHLVVSKVSNILNTIRKQHEQSISELGATARALNLRTVPSEAPHIKGFKLDFLYETFEAYPGGDFIDFIDTDNGHTFIILGDVMGKKWGAWFFSFNYLSYIRSAIRLCVLEGDFSTASIVNKINRVIYKDQVLNNVLSTLSLLVIDHETGEIHYTGAGDVPLILYRSAENECSQIKSSGVLLGVASDGQFSEEVIRMEPDDQLIVVTDGMIDFYGEYGTRTSYPLFVKTITPLLGKHNTFELIKAETFSEVKMTEVVDDRSLLFIQKLH